jgi:hypothetical protein
MGAPLEDALAYAGSGVTVLLPTRYVAFDTTRLLESTFGPDELKRKTLRTFREGELFKIAYNPRLHDEKPLTNQLLRNVDFQITYSFPTRHRVGVKSVVGKFAGVRVSYGSERFTYRQLYDFLCAKYNGGERFVDVYFQTIFPASAAGRAFKRFEQTVYAGLNAEHQDRWEAAAARRLTGKGDPDMRTAEGLRLKDFDVWKKGFVAESLTELERFRNDIRDEIIQCLSTGRIALNHANKAETMELRRRLGLYDEHEFFATGKLIESIEVDIRMPEDAFA